MHSERRENLQRLCETVPTYALVQAMRRIISTGVDTFRMSADGRLVRRLTNLGWLLRNWQQVTSFEVFRPSPGDSSDIIMAALLRDGDFYVTTWASRSVMQNWLDRPVFQGVPVKWHVPTERRGERDDPEALDTWLRQKEPFQQHVDLNLTGKKYRK